ncbi:MAG: amino acid ABC transporter permease [Erysipelotrichaceae bacterium]
MMKITSVFISKAGIKTSPIKIFINAFLVFILLVVLFTLSLQSINVSLDFAFLLDLKFRLWDGFLLTIALSITSLLVSLIIGMASSIGQSSNILFIRYLCNIYVTFIRGTPLIMQIYLFFYIVGTAWGITNRFIAGVLILSLFEGAYIAEIIRGSMLSIDASQLEASKAVGFNSKQTITNVILPQLIARTLPALTGQFASIIKDSSLLSMISIIELTQTMREISSTNFKLFECYLFLGLLYLCLTLPISYISKKLERRFAYEN